MNTSKWKDWRLAALAEQAIVEANGGKKKEKNTPTHIKVNDDKETTDIKVYAEEEVEPAKPEKSAPLTKEEVVKIGEYHFIFGLDEDDNIRVTFRSTNNFPVDTIEKLWKEIEKRKEGEKEQTELAGKAKKKK